MSCITNNPASLLLGLCTACLCLGPAWAGDTPAGAAETDRYLTVKSDGYSRYEIDGDDVVAFFTEGVEFDYLGFMITAGQLRYNHASQVATVTDNVLLTLEGIEAACSSLRLDGVAGQLELQGGITSRLAGPELILTCQELLATFPPGARHVELSDTDVSLTGAVEVRHADGHVLNTAGIHYNGERRRVETVGGFQLDTGDWQPTTTDSNLPDLSGLNISGAQLSAQINEDGGISSVTADAIVGESAELQCSAGSVHWYGTTPAATRLSLENSAFDVAGFAATIMKADQQYDLSSEAAVIQLDATGLASLRLSDAVRVSLPEGLFHTNELIFSRVADGFTFDVPSDVIFDFDLSAIGGISPISLDLSQESLGGL